MPVTAPTTSAAPRSVMLTQYYIDCLSQASYLVGDTSTGLAVVVDPRRDVQEYVDDAAAAGLRITGLINTHFHADFLSGHLESRGRRVPGSATAMRPGPSSRSERWLTGSASFWAMLSWRSCTPPDTPRSRSACWSMSTPATKPPTAS